MLSIVKSMALEGVNGYLVEIQTDVTNGLPSFNIVGLPDISIKEAKERVRTSLKNSNLFFPSKKILVNLAPANRKKEGTCFDLPIAISVLLASEKLSEINILDFEKTIFLGELSLDGKINSVNGILPMCIEAKNLGIIRAIVPKANAREAAVLEDLEIIPVGSINELVDYLCGKINIVPQEVNPYEILNKRNKYDIDFQDVKGQKHAKRALEISAAGGHNCLLIGTPGSGKSMLSKRVTTILPDLSFEESLEITKIYSVAGNIKDDESIIQNRPFRSPHHTSSIISLVGGGIRPKPGEISLAHYGVLFLDELPEFSKNLLETLRVPLEDKKIEISRLNSKLVYPCNFMLIASMNPCACGYYGSKDKECTCSPQSISRYMGKISGPLLDRIDIHIEVTPVKYKKLKEEARIEKSETIKKRVNEARKIQIERYKKYNLFSNAELTPKLIEEYCKLDIKAHQILQNAFEKLGLSARAYGRILKVARTIADLEQKDNIEPMHIAEAIQYRSLDRKYF